MTTNQRLIAATFLLSLTTGCTLGPFQANAPEKNDQELIEQDAPIEVVEAVEAKEQALESLETTHSEQEQIAQIEPELDLWQYIQSKQQLTQIQHPRIKQFENYFLKHAHLLSKKTDKAAPYLYYIIQELEKRDMPLELAFTPMVESNFDPLAHSVVQAAGLWQFMPRTAKGFGLEINEWYDGRRDVVASTDAALNYYQYLNKMFDGDWLLTVAAYNYGEGNVLKAIKRNKKAGKPTDYWSLKLPQETKRHIPKWLALSNVLINHPQFNLKLTAIKNQAQFTSIEVEAPINLVQLAKLTGLNKDQFYRLNPAFNRLFIPAEHQKADLLIPMESLLEFESKLASLPSNMFNVNFSYQVKAGDSLSRIAKEHKTKISTIKKLNHLKTDTIKIGQTLKLPGAVEVSQEETAFFSKLSNYQKRRKYQIYKVRSGDSLWKIAKKFKVSTKKIARWNGLSTSKILKIGQPLKIWPSS
ncbi:MAG: LysM peptidoglycan-binding domain-containing protein [Gammaproteobacteria bacterium]|nr:LysM peptidoglycan-binding domain-containing protein [Gammaproteobacteria bacterium]